MSKGKDFKFQIKLGGEFKDFAPKEDKLLKQAFLSGFPNAKYQSRGQKYEVDFKRMVQRNIQSGKERDMRPPHKWKAPVAPIMEAGPTTCIKVPPGSPGTTIQVPHPKDKSKFITVNVPASAKVGQAMLVPVPDISTVAAAAEPEPERPGAPAAPAGKKGMSTGAKVAAGAAGAVALGGMVVGGALLGEHIAEEGWDATMEDLGDWAADAGEAIADGAEAAVDWAGDAADTAGDFIMDLF